MQRRTIRCVIADSIIGNWRFFLCLICSELVITVSAGVVFIELIMRITDAIWQHQFNMLKAAVLALVFVKVAELACRLISGKVAHTLTMRLDYHLEDEVYHRYTLRQMWDEAARENVFGHMRKTIPNTAQKILSVITGIERMVVSLLCGIAYGMIQLNPYVTAICIAITLVMLLVFRKPLAKVKPEFKKIQQLRAKRFNKQMELVENREIGSFLRPEKTTKPYAEQSESYIQSIFRFKKLSNSAHMFSQFGSIMLVVLSGIIGGVLAANGSMSFSALLATIMLMPSFASSVFSIPSTIAGFRELSGSIASLEEAMNISEYNMEGREKLKETIKCIAVENLHYSYGEEEVLRGVNVKFTPGLYCLCGISGCGKSTLLKLLSLAMPYEKGCIKINRQRLHEIERKSYWQHITYIEQRFNVFSKTLRDNIVMGNNVNEAMLESSINQAGLKQYVSSLPDGLNTQLQADKLSSGENLKVGIARALYLNREVLLLDEVVEALDQSAEIQIVNELHQLAKQNDSIIICVSHRMPIAEIADRVVFMQEGRIAEVSTHASLMEHCSSYRRLWSSAEVKA